MPQLHNSDLCCLFVLSVIFINYFYTLLFMYFPSINFSKILTQLCQGLTLHARAKGELVVMRSAGNKKGDNPDLTEKEESCSSPYVQYKKLTIKSSQHKVLHSSTRAASHQ